MCSSMPQTSLWSLGATFPPESREIRRAREFARQTLVDHELEHLVDDVRLVVSELATNATKHAKTAYTVTFGEVGPVLLLTVHDNSSATPSRNGTYASPGTSGSGLHLVNHLCQNWGVEVMPDETKSVWATFPTRSRGRELSRRDDRVG
jgi:two-component sensor histidine kinase